MKCKICSSKTLTVFRADLIKKYSVDYFFCNNCGFLHTEEPYWFEEAYNNSINFSDTGYMQRNLLLSKNLTILLSLFFPVSGKYLDYAGGYGVFVRLMRDIGFDFYWDDKYTQNLFAKGFEYNKIDSIDAVTTFESFEHFVDPIIEIENLLNISRNIIFSTELLPNPVPKPEEWWYYGLDHGQHISFYSEKTFKFIADKYCLNYEKIGSLHLLTEKKISNFKLKILKLRRIGLHKILQRQLQSKTWSDFLLISCNDFKE